MTVPSSLDTRSLRYTRQITAEFKAARAGLSAMTPKLLHIFADGQVEVLDVPQEMLHAIKHSRLGERVQNDVRYVLREVLGAARRGELAEQINQAALSVWKLEIDRRKLSAKTVERKLLDVRRLGEIFNLDAAVQTVIHNEFTAARLNAAQEPSQRHADFRAHPLSPVDYAKAAHRVSEEAFHTTGNRQTVQRLFIASAVLSLLSFIPERVSDILAAVIGRDVSRDARGWSMNYKSQKTDTDRSFDYLPDQLTPYFDDLILLKADPGPQGRDFWHLYRQRVELQSPLFARTDLKRAYSSGRIFELVKAETGHGPHAARKAMADYLVETDASPIDVLDLLGHRRLSTSQKHYEVRADAVRRSKAIGKVDDLRAGLNETGSLRLASGQLIDLEGLSQFLNEVRLGS